MSGDFPAGVLLRFLVGPAHLVQFKGGWNYSSGSMGSLVGPYVDSGCLSASRNCSIYSVGV